ncbi:MAG: hypothetical protein RLZZ516_2415, partial [Cyanobacteriota bacterium]
MLVVGPGSGTELPGLLGAMPEASFTLVEPSEQMRGQCQGLIERIGAGAHHQHPLRPGLQGGGRGRGDLEQGAVGRDQA